MKYRRFHSYNQYGVKRRVGPVKNFFLNLLKWIGII